MTSAPGRRNTLAVIGGGWAGIAAAVEGAQRGHAVTLYEMAPQLGGRARALDHPDDRATGRLDNGQHILIGAYVDTLRLMRTVGVDVDVAFKRMPLTLVHADGSGLRLPPGPPALAFARSVWKERAWTAGERLALLAAAARWWSSGFRCDPGLTVAELTARLPPAVRRRLIDPLCVAALNTPSATASAQVFLRVLGDALRAGPGSADLLLPRVDLGAAWPAPAARWLQAAGSDVRPGTRVQRLEPHGAGWRVDGAAFDRVVLAATATEAARLTHASAPSWSRLAGGLRYEPIVTLYLQSDGATLPQPMLALASGDDAPAQFVFDRGRLGGPPGLLAFVVSGAAPWVERGAAATLAATVRQAEAALGDCLRAPLRAVRVVTEKRATFLCTPRLQRPPTVVAPGLHAAGDYVDGPYPATLEGAVRSAIHAVRAFG